MQHRKHSFSRLKDRSRVLKTFKLISYGIDYSEIMTSLLNFLFAEQEKHKWN